MGQALGPYNSSRIILLK